ncbi:PAS domain-containing sensor histidine kinase [Ancylomarina euxinus]|uniref:histidine kinase n=1 Tax=Ancylomarina euxinus TaxID=2283627 RepID=A0A425XXP8_9BACT|nr:PAS domain-containing hybrid sensor histidine kinase/response regulator [Ancylomarina euxinus]MCZ4695998.1 ATP-binding protein [Ancylomarina euxinus]MUP13939.1 response regulator [Ancylomarina euxinus]RRG19495.1 PAS domain-containing sensor histidine kinase [Ancylomarina euxinus]
MVEKCLQAEILLELVFSVSLEKNEQLILNKSLPLYLRKLNCFLAGVLKKDKNENIKELIVMPFAAGKSDDWDSVKKYFSSLDLDSRQKCPEFVYNNLYYYGLCLNGYGLFILGRKKAFDHFFIKELQNVVHHLGKILIQSNEIEKRERAEEKLRKSEKRLSLLMQESPYVIEIYSEDGIQRYVNKAHNNFWGVPSSKTLNKFNIKGGKDVKKSDNLQYVQKAFQGHSVRVPEFEIQIKNYNSGLLETRWLSSRMYPLKDDEGRVTNVVITHEDITTRKHAEKELLIAKERAEESDRLKSAFLANISHEIRTPMNGILGFTDILKQSDFNDIDQNLYIELIEQSGTRLLNIMDDLIDISKVESGQVELLISETNINEQVESVFNAFQAEANNKNIQLHIENLLPKADSIVRTDKEKLYTILRNLIKNAIKFSLKGSVKINVEKKGDYIEFHVKDNGIGIHEERQDAIFDRFIQADMGDKRAFEGAGLGLSISKAYVNMLGGEIWLKSKPNIGSKFYFTLPCDIEIKEDDGSEFINYELNESEMKLKVLIVEDDKISMSFIKLLLEPISRQIILAKNGEEAVRLYYENQDVDLILMDIKMPELDGYEATRQIRHVNKDVIIIAQTAYSLLGDRDKSIESGCNDYITKPIFKDKLMILIAKYFNHLVEN